MRWASAGGRTTANTHPFAMQGRIMAHNGGFSEISRVAEQLGRYRDLVLGDTDSERYFALITQQIDAHDGDVGAGMHRRRAPGSAPTCRCHPQRDRGRHARALGASLSRGQHALHIIERQACGSTTLPPGRSTARLLTTAGLHVRSATSSVHAPALQAVPTVVVASEELDGEVGWRMLGDGELVHVRPDLTVESAVVIPDPPARLVPLPAGPNIDT